MGYTADEIVGKHISTLMPPEHSEDTTGILERIRRGERVGHFETKRLTKDGRIIDVSLSVSPIRDADGKIIGASKVVRDITDRKQAEAERERLLATAEAAKSEAESANRMKDEFLADPLARASHPAQCHPRLGQDPPLRQSRCRGFGGGALGHRAEFAGPGPAHRRPARHLPHHLGESPPRSPAAAPRRDHRSRPRRRAPGSQCQGASAFIRCSIPSPGPVTGDAARLQQVVWNLLSNAVKFTPKGGKVQVLLERVNSHVEISVIDTGIGIKPEFLPHVFDRFRQADATTTRRHGGLGLGLSIVKQLVEMHGGSIRAKSPGEGQGATFTVTLPIIVVHPERPEPQKVRPKES